MSKKIKIDRVTGDKDKDILKHCYFLPADTTGLYNFYDRCGGLVAPNVSSGNDFSFTIDPYNWTITEFLISSSSTKGNASGNWSNNHPKKSIQDDGDGESGTFQAQTGGSPDPNEVASSATA